MRRIINWNQGWVFEKENECVQIDLPHTWNAEDGQGNANYYRGICIYKKEFKNPEHNDDEQVYIEFNGVNASAKIILNGREVANHNGGYSTFRVNITEDLQDENLLEVLVDNAPNDQVYPQKADFTFYGGIYRDVNLLIVPDTHFDLDYFGSRGCVITPKIEGENARVEFVAYYIGKADAVCVELEDGTETILTVSNTQKGVARGELIIPNVHLWNGLEDPYLYKAQIKLIQNGKVVDCVEERFGCRSFHFDSQKGFFLNGRSYPLRGVSRHQDRLGVGNAITKEMHDEDMDLILSVGANSIRLAHYQHDQYFYDLCDEKGIVAWAEIPYITVHMPNGRENTLQQMRELIVQNYNHASIMCWALSNEISLEGVTEDLMENHRLLNDLVHELDPIRASAMAHLFMLETDNPLVKLPDICGYNLYYGWYVGEMEDNDTFFDEFHEEHPEVCIGLTEYGADSVIRLQSPKPVKGDYTESYQANYHEHMLEMISKRPYLWGTYVWNMFEFAAAGREEAGDPGKNHKGLITFDRKEKKDAYYIYKAWWSKEPFVHLCGRRYRDRVEEMTEIKVYSNQKNISLYVDGKLVAEQSGEHVFIFQVPISSSHEIKAIAEGTYTDEMTIQKVDEPNPEYFMDATKVKNWFDEEEQEDADGEYLSLSSTMGEIQATAEGAALMEQMMSQMAGSVAGGMGKNAKIPKAMMKLIARQPLSKLLVQAGLEADSEQAKMLDQALRKIKKA